MGAAHIADVGAGTGKLTGRLLELGLSVEAVEPDPDMLAVLTRAYPAAGAHQAPAQALPLADASVDAVVAGDAWHWFPHEEASAEARRVLRPGGWVGLIWNLAKPVEPWEFELAGIELGRQDLVDSHEADLRSTFPLEQTQTATFPWVWEMTPDHWRSYLATKSAVAILDDREREKRLDASRDVIARVCQETGRPTAPLRHSELCLRWRPT
jgi:ubiquinone/menaquinone biosynthesis C-methylase UbiE